MSSTSNTAQRMTPAAIAANRFGLGARPGDVVPADASGARHWLLSQFDRFEVRPAAWARHPSTAELGADHVRQQDQMRGKRSADEAAKQEARRQLRREVRGDYQSAVQARMASALNATAPFVERMVHFWANHFAVSVEKPAVERLAGALEADAIRPHVLGRFEDMLMAVETHPAMLVYLDQFNSIGPGSPAAQRRERRNPQAQRGLNENLAREILELHTLGVRSGYDQNDVTELARALTGWTVAGLSGGPEGQPGSFVFRPALHEPGARTVLGRRHAQPGQAQGVAILHDLARAPATARHLATKLARHAVADVPPPALVDRLAAAYLRSDGSLAAMYRVLIDSDEAWAPQPAKFKTPWEWAVSSLRALGRTELRGVQAAQLLNQLAQPVWRPGSPAGFDDAAASWAAPDALVRRVELAQRLAGQVSDRVDARALAHKVLMGSLGPATESAIARAESASTGLALLLVSPELQRR